MTDEEHYKSLSKKPGSAGMLLMKGEQVLLVKPVYKEGWEIPGGAYEENESPSEALQREVMEEMGIQVNITGLAGIDYLPKVEPHRGDSLNFLFWADFLSPEDETKIILPETELSAWGYFSKDQILQVMSPYVRDRVFTILDYAQSGSSTPVYMENGKSLF